MLDEARVAARVAARAVACVAARLHEVSRSVNLDIGSSAVCQGQFATTRGLGRRGRQATLPSQLGVPRMLPLRSSASLSERPCLFALSARRPATRREVRGAKCGVRSAGGHRVSAVRFGE